MLIAALAGRHNWMTEWGAVLYFAARVAYVPLYAYGVRVVRSLAWSVATLGIILILVGLF